MARTFIAYDAAGEEIKRDVFHDLLYYLEQNVSGYGDTERITIMIMLPSGIQWDDLFPEEKNKIFREMDLNERLRFNDMLKARILT